MLCSDFRPVSTSVLQSMEGRKITDKIAQLNEDLEEIGFKIALIKVKKEQYMILTDMNDSAMSFKA